MNDLQSPKFAQNLPVAPLTMPNLYDDSVTLDALSINENYLTLEQNESVRGVIIGVEPRVIASDFARIDKSTGEILPIDVVSLLIQNTDGTLEQFHNASAMLVGVCKDALNRGIVTPLQTPVIITYLGKRQTKTKTFYDAWDLRLLKMAGVKS